MRNYTDYIICSHGYYIGVTEWSQNPSLKSLPSRVNKFFYSKFILFIIPIHFVLWFSLLFFFFPLKWFGFILFMCLLFGVLSFFFLHLFLSMTFFALMTFWGKEWCLCVPYSLWSFRRKHRGLYPFASILSNLTHSSLWYMVNNDNKNPH